MEYEAKCAERGNRTGTIHTQTHQKGDALTNSAMPAVGGGPNISSAVLLSKQVAFVCGVL